MLLNWVEAFISVIKSSLHLIVNVIGCLKCNNVYIKRHFVKFYSRSLCETKYCTSYLLKIAELERRYVRRLFPCAVCPWLSPVFSATGSSGMYLRPFVH
jgi:hypothetical protein